jgi:transmembrane sensor
MTMPTSRGDHPPVPPQIEDSAFNWLVKMTSGSATAEDREALACWLSESELNRKAYQEARDLWQQLGQLADRPLPRLHTEAEYEPAAMAEPEAVAMSPRRRLRFMAAAACAALFAVAAGMRFLPYWLADYATESGEIRTIALEDGSTIRLNTASALDVDYAPEHRSIRLLKGEAEFVVRKNSARPFIVTAGDESIRALGTDFIVRFDREAITVTQFENRVEIAAADGGPIRKVRLNPGQQLHRNAGEPLPSPVPVDTAITGAWRRGKLIFESAPLTAVIAEINRYRPGAVFLLGSKNAALPVSGVFDLNHLDRLLAVIERTLPVKALRLGKGVVLLY